MWFEIFWFIYSLLGFKIMFASKSEVVLRWDFLGIFYFGLNQNYILNYSWRFGIFLNLGISLNLGIFIPGIRDFLNQGIFISGDWGFFQIMGFLSPWGPGDRRFLKICGYLQNPRYINGDFFNQRIFGDGVFFVEIDIPPKSHFCSKYFLLISAVCYQLFCKPQSRDFEFPQNSKFE